MTSQASSSEIIIDGALMTSRAAAHDELARALNLPDYYGRNLDALYDCLSTMPVTVTILHPEAMLSALGSYGEKLMETIREATARGERQG